MLRGLRFVMVVDMRGSTAPPSRWVWRCQGSRAAGVGNVGWLGAAARVGGHRRSAGLRPGPVVLDAHDHAAAGVQDAGGHVQDLVAQPLGFRDAQVAVQAQVLPELAVRPGLRRRAPFPTSRRWLRRTDRRSGLPAQCRLGAI
jgi:hypothetical protein